MTGRMTPSRDIARLIEIMAALRTPVTGCPWDLAQTFTTIAPYTLEEAYEVADAIQRGDLADLKDELGDLLLQVVYHARMAEEAGAFQFGDVVEGVTRKMIRRHPHVFGDETARSPGDVDGLWARIKAEEKAEKAAARAAMAAQTRPSPLEGEVPRSGGGGRSVTPAGELSSTTPFGIPPTTHSGIPPTTHSGIPPTPNPSPQGGGEFPSILADVPIALPALTRAIKLQDKAAKVGFDWPSLMPVFDKLREELAELEEVALPHDPRGSAPSPHSSWEEGRGAGQPQAPLPVPQTGADEEGTSLPRVGRARVGGLRDEAIAPLHPENSATAPLPSPLEGEVPRSGGGVDAATSAGSAPSGIPPTTPSGIPPTAPSVIPPTPSPSPRGGGGSAIFEEFGDLLFVMANVARHLKIDPEAALRAANQKFVRRFTYIEQQLAAKSSSPAQSSLTEMDALWDEAKAREKRA